MTWTYRTRPLRRGGSDNDRANDLFREVSSGLSIGQRAVAQSLADASTKIIPSSATVIETLGYSTPGDGGGDVFVQQDSEPTLGPKFQNGGRWFGKHRGLPVNVRQFGAVLDGVTDDEAAFEAADAFGVYPIVIDGPAFMSTAPSPRWGQYQLVGDTAAVALASGTWLPGYKDVISANNHYITRSLVSSQDPSPTITGSEYPILDEAPAVIYRHYNFWGAQAADINDSNGGRTGLFQQRWIFNHVGEGDFYSWLSSGTVTPHPRASEITGTKGHNNGGIGGGQTSAAGDRVTLYGIGDIDLKDQGYDNVSMRGLVVHLDKEGDDEAYAYRADTFGLRIFSRETAVGNAINIDGPVEVGLSLTRVEASSNAVISMGQGQRISLDDSLGQASNSYNPVTFGAYWIEKTSSSAIDIVAETGKLSVSASVMTYTPASPLQYSFRVASSTAGVFATVGAAGSVAYFSAFSTGASNNTTLSLRTASAGIESDSVTIASTGHMNIARANAQLQIEGTQVLGSRRTGWGAPTGTATRTTFVTSTVTLEQLAERVKALIDDFTTHGAIGA